MHIVNAKMLCQRRIFFLYFFKHRIRNIAIRKMPGGPGAQLRDVNRLGEIHFEKGAFAEAQRDRILRILPRLWGTAPRQFLDAGRSSLHRRRVRIEHAGRSKLAWNFISVLGSELLLDLDTAAVAVHVTEAANVHQDVEAELLARAEGAKHLV